MKKLSLEMLRLSTEDVLERSQMKKITGGDGGSGTCWLRCSNDWQRSMQVPFCGSSTVSFYCLEGSEATCNCN
ncbi:hypothetical protein E1898_00200 [Algoriphagus formosus]|uniref:Natural product n=1 Tax=Algoriphagus formosus TaxID=2007308 RepID=A0A4R5VGQ3_9BACT|nr:hypothetical protein E1898_00200 [Algoriphagus aquimaris]